MYIYLVDIHKQKEHVDKVRHTSKQIEGPSNFIPFVLKEICEWLLLKDIKLFWHSELFH